MGDLSSPVRPSWIRVVDWQRMSGHARSRAHLRAMAAAAAQPPVLVQSLPQLAASARVRGGQALTRAATQRVSRAAAQAWVWEEREERWRAGRRVAGITAAWAGTRRSAA